MYVLFNEGNTHSTEQPDPKCQVANFEGQADFDFTKASNVLTI